MPASRAPGRSPLAYLSMALLVALMGFLGWALQREARPIPPPPPGQAPTPSVARNASPSLHPPTSPASSSATCAPVGLAGTVADRDNRQAVQGARVRWLPQDGATCREALADALGNYSLEIPACEAEGKTFRIEASADGYLPSTGAWQSPLAAGVLRIQDLAIRKAPPAEAGLGQDTLGAFAQGTTWLASHQAPDGHWEAAVPEDTLRVTALGVLAFLGEGKTDSEQFRRALAWIQARQNVDGQIDAGSTHPVFDHAIAAQALAEACAMGVKEAGPASQHAVDYIVKAQNQGGGWGYTNIDVKDDFSKRNIYATVWNLMALKSARTAGLAVPDAAFQGGNTTLDDLYSTSTSDKGTFGYHKQNCFVRKEPYTSTAMGVSARLLAGSQAGVDAGIRTLMDRLPDWKQADLTYWYFGTLATYQQGREPWKRWQAALEETLRHPPENPVSLDSDVWASGGGEAYAAAMGSLIRSVYFRE